MELSATQYTFKTDNGMYWSNDYTANVAGSSAQTLALTTNDESFFEMNGTGAGHGQKFLVSADGTYLQWKMSGALAVIEKSKYTSSNIPKDNPNLIFIFETYDNANQFRLYIKDTATANKLYLKRVSAGYSNNPYNYIVAIPKPDSFGIFTKTKVTST